MAHLFGVVKVAGVQDEGFAAEELVAEELLVVPIDLRILGTSSCRHLKRVQCKGSRLVRCRAAPASELRARAIPAACQKGEGEPGK